MLVFSVDPQASLSDIFKQDIFGKGAVEIMPNLYRPGDRRGPPDQGVPRRDPQEDPGYVRACRKIPEEIESYIQAAAAEPAMEESAIFDEVVDIVVKGGYDYYIYDLVPLGHALYYLSMASVYDAWIDKITNLRGQMQEYDQVAKVIKREKEAEEDQILKELIYIKDRINKSVEHPHGQAEDGLLLRHRARGDDYQRYPEGRPALRQIRRSPERLYHQPGPSPGAQEPGNPGIPAQPDHHAG